MSIPFYDYELAAVKAELNRNMPEDQIDARLDAFSERLDENIRLTLSIDKKMDIHAKEHEAISKHMQETSNTLYFGYAKQPGLIYQVQELQSFRDNHENARAGWAVWLGVIGGILAGISSIALVIVESLKKSRGG